MYVPRVIARFCAVSAGVAGLGLAMPAMAAAAAPGAVSIGGLPSAFQAGGGGGTLTITVTKSSDGANEGCTQVRYAIVIRLSGLNTGEVIVSRPIGGAAVPLTASGGRGTVRVEDRFPGSAPLCGSSVSADYQVRFLAGAPGGRATFTAEAFRTDGHRLGSASGSSLVTNRVAASASASGKPSSTSSSSAARSASPSASASSGALPATTGDSSTGTGVAVAQPPADTKRASSSSGLSGTSAVLIVAGAALVLAGLVVLLTVGRGLWRRGDNGPDGPGSGGLPPDGDPTPTVVLPKFTG
jgi:hypothetical protein